MVDTFCMALQSYLSSKQSLSVSERVQRVHITSAKNDNLKYTFLTTDSYNCNALMSHKQIMNVIR